MTHHHTQLPPDTETFNRIQALCIGWEQDRPGMVSEVRRRQIREQEREAKTQMDWERLDALDDLRPNEKP